MKKLGGALFVWNGVKQDYSHKESIHCLLELCDEVSIVYGGDDGTEEEVEWAINEYSKNNHDQTIYLNCIDQDIWDAHQGREKISYFMNLALLRLQKCEWAYSLQADEIIYERSFPHIRAAIEQDAEAFVSLRYNAWRDPLSMLNVPQEHKPCSTEIIRLAKTKYLAYGDGEHLNVPSVQVYKEPIEVYHCGYIRDSIKMVVKSRNMLVDIFGVEWDTRIGEKFDYRNFPFTDNDIVPVPLPLPKFILKWAQERYPDLSI